MFQLRLFTLFLLLVCLLTPRLFLAQNYISDLILRLDTSVYSWEKEKIDFKGRKVLPISYSNSRQVAEFELDLRIPSTVSAIKLLPSEGYELIDSILLFDQKYFSGRLRFDVLDQTDIGSLAFRLLLKNGDSVNIRYPFLPIVAAPISTPPQEHTLVIGEVYSMLLLTEYDEVIQTFSTWKKNNNYAYRITRKEGQTYLNIIPFAIGEFEVKITANTIIPNLVNGVLRYYQRIEPFNFTAKKGSLKFLDLGRDEVLLGRKERSKALDITFNRPLELDAKRVYRIEEDEDVGSRLVGELFTKKLLPNGQVQAQLKIYDYHDREKSTLYLKDGERSLFLVNINIIPTPSVSQVFLARKKGEWKPLWKVRPGEEVWLKWEGESLDKARWELKGLQKFIEKKNTKVSSQQVEVKVTIPKDIREDEIPLLLGGEASGFKLEIQEYDRPHPLSFVSLGFPKKRTRMYGNKMIDRPYYIDQFEGFDIRTHEAYIEAEEELYGVQHIYIYFTLYDPEGRILEEKKYRRVQIRPGEHSPRHVKYSTQAWGDSLLELRKVFEYLIGNADAWSKMNIRIGHDSTHYENKRQGMEAIQFNLILRKQVQFDIEVGFPVGIIANHPDHEGGTRIDGASFFLMGQIGFYQRNKVNQLHKFRLGFGPVALNALNLRKSNRVDLGVAGMLMLYPTNQRSKVSVPLSIGGGYAITRDYWFLYAGAGVSVRL